MPTVPPAPNQDAFDLGLGHPMVVDVMSARLGIEIIANVHPESPGPGGIGNRER